jgi:VanZ family protein
MINNKTKNLMVWCLRILLTVAFFAVMAWIFSNSLKDATQSSAQSSQVTEDIKQAIETVKPDVSFGGATDEEDFHILHGYIRDFGHFAEFALLCALCVWCIRSWTPKKFYLFVPIPSCIAVAIFDEYLQTFSDGRAQQISDVFTDTAGACTGFAFAICSLLVLAFIYQRWKRKESEKIED